MKPPKHILCTRPLDALLIEQAAQKGILIETLSFIATEPIRDEALTQRVQHLGSLPLTVVFTSMNAVEAIVRQLRQPASWKVFCIGSATRELVHAHFGEDAIAGTAPSATELADVILQQHPSEIFFFCGDQRREELPNKLSTAGVQVNELAVYRTTQTPHLIKEPYDGIAFFSPSAVHSFFSMNVLPRNTRIFAIGKTTTDAVLTYTNNPVITSQSPEKEALVRQLIDYFYQNI